LRTTTELPDEAYIGMELDGERNQYHFNARSYDAGLSRFFAPDLLFEEMPNQSPYSYSNNSPVNFKDPSGLQAFNPIFNNIDPFGVNSNVVQVIDGMPIMTEKMEENEKYLRGAANGSDGDYLIGLGDTYNGLNNDGTAFFGDGNAPIRLALPSQEQNGVSLEEIKSKLRTLKDLGNGLMLSGVSLSIAGGIMTASGNPLGASLVVYGLQLFEYGNLLSVSANSALLAIETWEATLGDGNTEGLGDASLDLGIDIAVGGFLKYYFKANIVTTNRAGRAIDPFTKRYVKNTYYLNMYGLQNTSDLFINKSTDYFQKQIEKKEKNKKINIKIGK
jgi:RHS repeat-associated protein